MVEEILKSGYSSEYSFIASFSLNYSLEMLIFRSLAGTEGN